MNARMLLLLKGLAAACGAGATGGRAPLRRARGFFAAFLAFAGLVVGCSGESERQMAGGARPVGERYFALDVAGRPWRAISVMDAANTRFPQDLVAYFGTPGAVDPFATRDAVVRFESDPFSAAGASNATVNGAPAEHQTGIDLGLGEGRLVSRLSFVVGDRWVTILSRQLDQRSMIELAEALRLDGAEIVAEGEPAGLRRVGRTQSSERRAITYRRDDRMAAGGQVVTLVTRPGDSETMAQLRWFGATPTEVGGRAGWFRQSAVGPNATAFDLTWLHVDGVMLSIGSAGSELEARELAGLVREVDQGEWDQLKAAASAGMRGVAGRGDGELGGPATSPSVVASSTTSVHSSPVSSTSSAAPVIPDLLIPVGRVAVEAEDLLVVSEDGDLWLRPGLLSAAPGVPIRLVDLDDPRVVDAEGPGANRVYGVVGPTRGLVFYTDCCEPVSGNLYALAGDGAGRRPVMPGTHVALRPDSGALATVNTFALSVVELPSGRQQHAIFDTPMFRLDHGLGLIWAADGRSLIALDVGPDRFELIRVDASAPFARRPAVTVATGPRPVSSEVDFAGRGPAGEIVVAVAGSDRTRVRYFDGDTLAELPVREQRLPTTATAVRVAPDGISLLWVEGGELWYRSANGTDRRLGSGISAGWFTTASQ